MTRGQKQRLAWAVLCEASKFGEFWDELSEQYELADLPREEALRQISAWLGRLPGRAWPTLLPGPSAVAQRKAGGRQ